MKKKILVIGGSAFVGRIFSIQTSKREEEFELHVVNRGHYPLNLENVKEYKCDRHTPHTLARILPDIVFDALVDFCAYTPGEIQSLLGVLGGRIKQYIFFSTASVYAPLDHSIKRESDPVVQQAEGDSPVSDYIYNKLLLERELIEGCGAAGIPYTIFRPTFIYGPFNYAPRESYFIELIARKYTVPVPVDATAKFSFVYVFDVADAVLLTIGDSRAYDNVFNLAGPERITYERLLADFERFNGGPFQTSEVTVQQALDEHIPLPFPLTDDDLCSGEKFRDTFHFSYTPFAEGMEKTFKIFYSLFVS